MDAHMRRKISWLWFGGAEDQMNEETSKMKENEAKVMRPTTPGVPVRSPITVLTQPDRA